LLKKGVSSGSPFFYYLITATNRYKPFVKTPGRSPSYVLTGKLVRIVYKLLKTPKNKVL